MTSEATRESGRRGSLLRPIVACKNLISEQSLVRNISAQELQLKFFYNNCVAILQIESTFRVQISILKNKISQDKLP